MHYTKVCQQYVNDSPILKLNLKRSHDRYFATSKTQLWNVPTPTLAFVKHQGEKEEGEGEGTAKNVGAPKTELIVPGYSCVPSANSVETLGMTNLRTHKMLIASLAGKSPWIKLTRRENHCMLCKFKQAWCTLWLNSSNLSSENYNFKAQTWIQTKRQRKESIKSENVIHFTFRCPMLKE